MKNKFFLIFLLFSLSIFAKEYQINQIILKGNNFLSDEEILGKLQYSAGNRFKIEYMEDIAQSISKIYESSSFYGVEIYHPKIHFISDEKVDITVKIVEKREILVDSLKFSGLRYFTESKLKEKISQQKLRNIKELEDLIEEISNLYQQREFLFVKTKLDSLEQRKEYFTAFISVDEGKICNFKNLHFKGNEVTTAKTILKLAGFNQIKKYDKFSLEKAGKKISQRKYIKEAQLIPIDSNSLLFLVKEGNMTKISGLLGYSNTEDQSLGNSLTGFINLKFFNLFGSDRNLEVSWNKLNKYDSDIKFKYHESGPDRISIAGDFFLQREQKDSTYIKTTFDSEVYYYFTNNKLGVYFGLDDYFPGTRRPILVESTKNMKIGLFWDYSNIFDLNNPSKGQALFSKYYYLFKNNQILYSSENMAKNFIDLPGRLVWANIFKLDMIENKKLENENLYNLGGFGDLRGFEENIFKGYKVFCLNNELRYLFSSENRAYLFLDYGYVENDQRIYNSLWGGGFGLSFMTRLGMFGISYAINYQNGKVQNISEGILHFGLETEF